MNTYVKKAVKALLLVMLFVGRADAVNDVPSVVLGTEPQLDGKIAITIDDCADEKYLVSMISLLESKKINATLFPNTNFITEEDPEVWQQVVDDGFEIGYHTTDHKSGKTKKQYLRDFDQFVSAFESFTDRDITIYFARPPYGVLSDDWYNFAYSDDLVTAWWSFVPTNKNTFHSFDNVWSEKGGIILLHTNEADNNWLSENIDGLISLIGGSEKISDDTFPTLSHAFELDSQ